jgi:hypothetical protein
MQQLGYNNGNGMFIRGLCRDVITKGQSQLVVIPILEAVKRGPERMKLKNLHC